MITKAFDCCQENDITYFIVYIFYIYKVSYICINVGHGCTRVMSGTARHINIVSFGGGGLSYIS